MFARILEFAPVLENKDEFIHVVRKEVLPILRKQGGFLEILPLVPENKTEKVVTITLWAEKKDFERYEKETYPRIEQILKPYFVTPVAHRVYTLETTLCEHFEKMLVA
jgi:heme-degrading monooxygenase HmoA